MSSIEAGTSVEKAPFKKKRVHELGLDAMFSPKSVALIGATDRPGTAGRATLENLKSSGFAGKLYAVNPNRPEVLGIKAYKSIGEVPGPVDLAVIVTPAVTVPGVVGECVDAEVKAAIVISAGFRERGPEGKALEQQIQQQLQRGEMRLVGPNCLGIINARSGLNATFTPVPAKRGNIAFLSQSGALLTTLLDWSLLQEVGFSAVVSTGSMLDVGWGDLIYHFGDDAGTRSILLYMESVGDARSFLSAAREVALSKPIIVIKAGRSSEAAQAAASHTGALTGSDEVLDAAFQRAGVLRVQRLADLFSMAEVLDKQPRPRGPRLVIVSNAGGPAVLATDALIAEGGELAPLAEETIGALNEFLPSHWSHGNPVDVLGDTDAVSYLKAVEVAAKDASADGVLMIMAPHGLTDAHQVATSLQPFAASCHKTLLASWMGGECALAETASLAAAGIPSFVYPDMAARTFARMWRYNYNLKVLYETPVLEPGAYPAMSGGARACEEMIQRVRSRGRTLLNEFESKQLLAAYGIPVVETRIALTEDEAVEQAAKIGYPVVLKLLSETISHKTDVGGVKLNLADENSVRQAFRQIKVSVTATAGPESVLGVTVQPMILRDGWELILGSSTDPQFGPVILFGSGGQLVEVYRDHALALPPLNTTLAHRLMEQTRIYTALKGVRGRKPVDMDALEALLVRFSRLVVEQPWIAEIDMNPLLVSSERFLALDARVLLHNPALRADQLPQPAIRPYPAQYISQLIMKDGTRITVRPIRPEDEPLMVGFHKLLSDQSVYQRFFRQLRLDTRVAHDRLVRICFGDYSRDIALVAELAEEGAAESKDVQAAVEPRIVAVGRLNRLHARNEAEVAVLIADGYQHRGLGTEILRRVVQVAREERMGRLSAEVLTTNIAMQRMFRRMGFHLESPDGSDSIHAELQL